VKKLTFKTETIHLAGRDEKFDYKEQLQGLMRSPLNPQAGADFEEVRKSVRVLQAILDVKDGVLSLEDADYEFGKQKLNAMRFGVIDRALLDFKEWYEHPE
jgi:hypothetical protein